MVSTYMLFRLDIQILRGIAVLYVILFHLNFEFFNSGFLGVDVFFVISGYLMTVIYKNSNAINFYKKRAKRLLPAYFFTIFIAILLAVVVVNPIDLEEVLEEAIYASLFLSNIGFLNIDTYYSSTEFRPLLHFWSLNVEIQFYLMFPLLFYFARKHLIFVLLIIGFSFTLCIYLVAINFSDASFFLMPTRIWEFFLGYVAAKYFNNEGQTNLSIPAMGLLGLVIILCIPLMPVDEHSTSIVFGHPGLWALFVCSATVLILVFKLPVYIEKCLVGKVLVQAGKYSYSAYLAHFIVIILYNYQPFAESNMVVLDSILGIFNNIVLIIILTFIIYNFGEKWFQKKSFSRKRIAGNIALLLMAGLISKPVQFQLLSDKEKLLYEASLNYSSKRCSAWQQIKNFNKSICALTDVNIQNENILLVGDSHAGAISSTFSSMAERLGYNVFLTKKNGALTKGALSTAELTTITIANNIDSVVFHYATQTLTKDNGYLLHEIKKFSHIAQQKGLNVSFIMPTPELIGKHPLKEIYQNIKNKKPLSFISIEDYQKRNSEIAIFLNDLNNLIEKYDTAHLFCHKNCNMIDELHQPIYVDAGHLTKTGASILLPVFKSVFENIAYN